VLIAFVIVALLAFAGIFRIFRRRVFEFDFGSVSQNWLVTRRLKDEQRETRLWT
jgi:hypothetical protein